MWGSMWDLCGLSLLSWKRFWIRAIISTGFKILFYRINMKSCSILQITGEKTSLSLYSKLDLYWCLWHEDLQLLLTRYLPFSAPMPLRWHFTAPLFFWHSLVTLSCHRQSWPAPGMRHDSLRSPGILVKVHHNPTIIKVLYNQWQGKL